MNLIFESFFFSLSEFDTIESMQESKNFSMDTVFETCILELKRLPDTQTFVFKIGDSNSKRTMDMYVHQKFYLMNGKLFDGFFSKVKFFFVLFFLYFSFMNCFALSLLSLILSLTILLIPNLRNLVLFDLLELSMLPVD